MAEEDFDIDALAAYLHLMPAQVSRMADRGKLPGRRVSGKWRFSRAEIHHWLEHRIGASDEQELVQMEKVLDRAAPSNSEDVSLAAALPIEAMAFPLAAKTRGRAVSAMVELAAETGWLWDTDKMAEAVLAREQIQPTALDIGVALLHPRRPMPGILGEAFVSLGITPTGIPFGGSGSQMTDVFFLILSTDDEWHLRMLARISRLLSTEVFLSELRDASDSTAAREVIERFEDELA
jgi:PTS system nitrogen regulatory IIA component